jgi:Na+-driven multidrug efflux pump
MIDLLKNAFLLFLNSSLATFCSLVFFKFIGSDQPDNYYLMSLYFPFTVITIAIIESLKIPFYVNARAWADSKNLTGNIFSAIIFGLAILLVFGTVFFFGRHQIFSSLSIPVNYQTRFLGYVTWMLVSSACALVLNVFTAVIFVHKGPLPSFLFNLAAMTTANVIALALYFKTKDLNSIGVGIAATMAVASPLTFIYLGRKKFVEFRYGFYWLRYFSGYVRDYVKFSLPYALTFLLYGIYAYTLNTIVADYGLQLTAVFGIFSRVQNALIIPAVAIGTYTAVKLMSLENRKNSDEVFFVRLGLKASFMVYAGLALVALTFRSEIASVFTNDATLIALFRSKFPWILAITFLLGPIIFIISFLEQSGRALNTLVINFIFLSVELAILLYVNARFVDINYVFASIVAIKAVAVLYLFSRPRFREAL